MGWADTQAPTQQGPGLTAPETLVVGTLTPFQPWGTSEPRIFKVWPLSLYPVASRKLGWLQSDAITRGRPAHPHGRLTHQQARMRTRVHVQTHTHTPHTLSLTRGRYSTSSRSRRLSFRVYLALPVTLSTGPLST